jgi:purine-binding chemotaxis protein CheW
MTDESAARIERILEERAQALARVPAAEAVQDKAELVVLAVGAERYGIDILKVQTIQALTGLARVPGLPGFWAGLVNLRGGLYPVLNLRRYLALPGQPPEGGKVVLVAGAGLNVAVWVDDVLEIRRVPHAQIGAPLADAATAAQRGAGVRGVTPDLLVVLDLEILLGDPRLLVQASL